MVVVVTGLAVVTGRAVVDRSRPVTTTAHRQVNSVLGDIVFCCFSIRIHSAGCF